MWFHHDLYKDENEPRRVIVTVSESTVDPVLMFISYVNYSKRDNLSPLLGNESRVLTSWSENNECRGFEKWESKGTPDLLSNFCFVFSPFPFITITNIIIVQLSWNQRLMIIKRTYRNPFYEFETQIKEWTLYFCNR